MKDIYMKGGSFERCLKCTYLGNGCDGPRTSSMSTERWCEFVFMLKKLRGYTNTRIAESTGISEASVERIMAGTYPKDIRRSTAGAIEDFLIGSKGHYPCAMDSAPVVYQDTPETLAKLERLRTDKQMLQHTIEAMQASTEHEIALVREEMQRTIDFLMGELDKKDKRIEKLIDKLVQ